MIIGDISKVNPSKDMVIVKLVKLDVNTVMHSDEESIAVRYGEVISKGPEVVLPSHCPDLEVGDIAIFTEFAGYYIATSNDELCKAVRGYDIIGRCKTMEDIDKAIAIPTADRVLVEELDKNAGSDILLGDSNDPRLSALSYGVIKAVGPSIKNTTLAIGLVVSYAPYVGTLIREYESEEAKALKIIVEDDILMTVTQ